MRAKKIVLLFLIVFLICCIYQKVEASGKYSAKEIGLELADALLNKDFNKLEFLLKNFQIEGVSNLVFKIKTQLKFAKGKDGIDLLLYRPFVKGRYEEAYFAVKYENLVIFVRVITGKNGLRHFIYNTSGRDILEYNIDIIKPNFNVKEDFITNLIQNLAVKANSLYDFYMKLFNKMTINVLPEISEISKRFKITEVQQTKISYFIGPVETRFFYITAKSENTETVLLCEIEFYRNKFGHLYINSFVCH
jgi:hypothetical protein